MEDNMENLTTEQIVLIRMLSDLIAKSEMSKEDQFKAQTILLKITESK